jgi:hypothetical protein
MNADDGFDIFLLSFYASMKSQNVKILPGAFLKVPKCEILHLFDFNEFYGVKSL